MKTTKLLLLTAAACFSFAACSDDDTSNNDNNGDNENIKLGTYYLVGVNITEEVDFNEDGQGSSNLMNESTCYENSYITLNEDHTFTSSYNYVDFAAESGCHVEDGEGTWEISGDILTITNTIMDVPLEMIYTVSEDGSILISTMANSPYPTRDEEGNPVYETGSVQLVYNFPDEE